MTSFLVQNSTICNGKNIFSPGKKPCSSGYQNLFHTFEYFCMLFVFCVLLQDFPQPCAADIPPLSEKSSIVFQNILQAFFCPTSLSQVSSQAKTMMRGRKKIYEWIKVHEKSLLILAFFVKLNLACNKRLVLFTESRMPQTGKQEGNTCIAAYLCGFCVTMRWSVVPRETAYRRSAAAPFCTASVGLSPAFWTKKERTETSSVVSHVRITSTSRCSGLLTQVGSHQPASRTFSLAARGGQLEKPQSRDQHRFNGTPLLCK